jgi:hypothetical protein
MKATVTVTTHDGIKIAADVDDNGSGAAIASAVNNIRAAKDSTGAKVDSRMSDIVAKAIGDFCATADSNQTITIENNGYKFELVMTQVRRLKLGEGV